MPKSSSKAFDPVRHLSQGSENEKLARALIALDSCYRDWVIVVVFYAALHYIYSKLPTSNVPHTHEEAKPLILKHCGSKVFSLYSELSDKSRNARYYPKIAQAYRENHQVADDCLKALDVLKKELNL